jgi:DNA-binding transcriptional ArsR family regulator
MDEGLRAEINHLHAQICQALADSNRILILYTLADQPHPVSEICDAIDAPQPTVSRHLKVLRDRGLVSAERQGQSVVYAIEDQRIIQALDTLRAVLGDHLAEHGDLGRRVAKELSH